VLDVVEEEGCRGSYGFEVQAFETHSADCEKRCMIGFDYEIIAAGHVSVRFDW
jgi:hypothetical protein